MDQNNYHRVAKLLQTTNSASLSTTVLPIKVSKFRKQIMVPKLLPIKQTKLTILEDYYFKVDTKESLSSYKKTKTLFCTNLDYTKLRIEIFC